MRPQEQSAPQQKPVSVINGQMQNTVNKPVSSNVYQNQVRHEIVEPQRPIFHAHTNANVPSNDPPRPVHSVAFPPPVRADQPVARPVDTQQSFPKPVAQQQPIVRQSPSLQPSP